jgi:hypothetical protein
MRYATPRRPGGARHRYESLYYSMWNGRAGSPAHPIAPPQAPILRSAIAVDDFDVLHLLFLYSPSTGYDLHYRQAPASEGFSLGGWIAPRLINTRWNTYSSDIATHQGTVHAVYDDAGPDRDCAGCSSILYRRSTDGGWTWTDPMELEANTTGSSRVQMKINRSGTIYVAWDEGFDTRSARGQPRSGVLVRSPDGGATWSAPTVVTWPNATNTQLSVGADGRGGVMLVWRTSSVQYPGIYYAWSTDEGDSWSLPQAIPGVAARPGGVTFDVYDMAADSAGHLHLLAAAHLSAEEPQQRPGRAPPGLYHFEWDGSGWSAPTPVYEGGWYPVYPRLVIERGNQLHAAWFIRADPTEDRIPHQVWYRHGRAAAPEEPPVAPPPPAARRGGMIDPRPFAVDTSTPPAPSAAAPAIYRREMQALLFIASCVAGALLVVALDAAARFRKS